MLVAKGHDCRYLCVMTLSPNHQRKRARLSALSLILLLVGVPILLFGVYSFGSGFFTTREEFFANSSQVMDQSKRFGFVGIVCIGIGGMFSALGIKILFFSHAGKIARYAAGELTPIAHDVGKSLAPTIGEIVKQARGDDGRVLCGKCDTGNNANASFCDGCGAKLATCCSSCGAQNDMRASFCDQCGGQVAAAKATDISSNGRTERQGTTSS